MSAGRPWMWTGRIARVRSVIFEFDLADVEVEGLGVDVDEDRDRALVEDRLEGPGERVRGRDDLVARLDTDRVERRVDGGGPGVQEQRVPGAHEARPLALERRHLGRADTTQHPAFEDAGDRGAILGPDVRPDPLVVLRDGPRSAVDRQTLHVLSSSIGCDARRQRSR